MSFLGIDFGLKRVGVAVSDGGNVLAFPLVVIDNNKDLLNKIKEIVKDRGISKIIVGESKDYQMNDNPIMDQINNFVEELRKETSLEVELHPEFMSSMQAQKEIGSKTKQVDAQAAAIVLQSYLDSNK